MLVCSFVCANRTRDRGCSKHPVFPAPSLLREGEIEANLGRPAPREGETVSTSLRAKRSNPLSPHAPKDGLLRCARNDVEGPQRSAYPRTRGRSNTWTPAMLYYNIHSMPHDHAHHQGHAHSHGPATPHPAQAAPWSILRMTVTARLAAALAVSAGLWGIVWLAMR